jgi:formate C-acetyltransferase
VEKTRVGSSGCYNFTYADLFNYPSHTRINLPKLLDSVFEDEIVLSKIKNFDDFYKAYLEKYDELVKQCVVISDWFDSIADGINPANIFSGTVTTALEKAEDMFMSGAKYNDTIIIIACPATVFDSMIMVKKYVFDKKVISLGELKKALDADWAGYENLRRTILLDHDKWGNNIGWVDDIAVSLYTHLVRTINANKNKRGGNYITYGETIDFDIRFAPKVKATPDGRKAGEILSKGLIANNGQDRSGITALINSVTKLPSLEMAAGAPFDYMIHPSMIQGEEGLEAITGMLRTFFAQGGYSFMGNILDVETMLKAQREPEEYKNLQVRLCGWNVHFNDLMKLQQDQLIKQAASS